MRVKKNSWENQIGKWVLCRVKHFTLYSKDKSIILTPHNCGQYFYSADLRAHYQLWPIFLQWWREGPLPIVANISTVVTWGPTTNCGQYFYSGDLRAHYQLWPIFLQWWLEGPQLTSKTVCFICTEPDWEGLGPGMETGIFYSWTWWWLEKKLWR